MSKYFIYGLMKAGKTTLMDTLKNIGNNTWSGENLETLATLPDDTIVFLDEVQFYTLEQIDVILKAKQTIFCFGLLTDYKQREFESSRYLLNRVDSSLNMQSNRQRCHNPNCSNKPLWHIRTNSEEQLFIKDKDIYNISCSNCLTNFGANRHQ